MSKTCIVYHHKNDSAERELEIAAVKEALSGAFSTFIFKYVDNNKDFLASLEERLPDLVIFDWAAFQAPTEVVELYYQSLHAKNPMIIYFEHFSEEELTFLGEYNIDETVSLSLKRKASGYLPLIAAIKNTLTPSTDKIKKRLIELQFYHYLNNHKVVEAFELYKKIHAIVPDYERAYFQAKILKAQKKYAEALQKIANEKNKTLRLVLRHWVFAG